MSGGLGDAANNLGSQLGMINALRTGNPMLDMAICMLIPVFFQMLVQVVQQFQPMLNRFISWLNSGGEFYTRAIEFECRTTPWGSVIRNNGKEERNNILQKAIILYVGELKSIEYLNAKISLMAVSEKAKRDDDTYEMVYGSTADQLSCYSVNVVPPDGTWVTLRENLQFMQNLDEEENGGNKEGKSEGPRKNVTTYHFKCPKACGEKLIEDFIQEAFDWYVAKVKANQDHGRYLYMLIKTPASASSDKENEDSGSRIYKRYKLSGEKTFQSMFFKEKQMMLKLLGHFEKKTGKYAIKGFPHKLGLLLHGPPGTGKTSLIKALAEHTGRSVVSISLSRIETNQELMDIVFDQSFLIKGEDMPIKLGFKDIIFVMEDVDAASPIVHARSVGEVEAELPPKPPTPAVKLQRQVTTGGTEVPESVTNETIEVVKSDKTEATKAQGDMTDGDLVAALLTSLTDPVTDGKKVSTSKYFSAYDKLDLAGLLNVLDGVVDCPNRILVMTTNHPEKLDAALIRPGRIDKIVYLGYIQAEEAFEMVEHYFQEPLNDDQKQRIEAALSIPLKTTPSAYQMYGDKGFTPAELEQMCAEYDGIDEFLTNLEDRVLENSADGPPDLEKVPTTLAKSASVEHVPTLRRGFSTGSKKAEA